MSINDSEYEVSISRRLGNIVTGQVFCSVNSTAGDITAEKIEHRTRSLMVRALANGDMTELQTIFGCSGCALASRENLLPSNIFLVSPGEGGFEAVVTACPAILALLGMVERGEITSSYYSEQLRSSAACVRNRRVVLRI